MKINSVLQMERNKTVLLFLKHINKINNTVNAKKDIGGIKLIANFALNKLLHQVIKYHKYATAVLLIRNLYLN